MIARKSSLGAQYHVDRSAPFAEAEQEAFVDCDHAICTHHLPDRMRQEQNPLPRRSLHCLMNVFRHVPFLPNPDYS